MKLGFFGGAFNPPTLAHLEIAKIVLNEENLDYFYFVPMGNNYNKKGLIDEKIRFEMLKIICKDEEKIKVTDIELNKKDSINTYQAFEMIKKEFKNNEIFFIMGADNFEKMPNWDNFGSLVKNNKYIIVNRNNIDTEKIIKNNEFLNENRKNFKIINIKSNYNCVNSTLVRELICKKDYENAEKYISKDIAEFIKNNEIWN